MYLLHILKHGACKNVRCKRRSISACKRHLHVKYADGSSMRDQLIAAIIRLSLSVATMKAVGNCASPGANSCRLDSIGSVSTDIGKVGNASANVACVESNMIG